MIEALQKNKSLCLFGFEAYGGKLTFSKPENRFNYRLTLFTFTSFNWIYDSFYTIENGIAKKKELFYL